ncbi:MAG: CHASE3 domain-containing protein [Candidatus Acidiferrales bacterium]
MRHISIRVAWVIFCVSAIALLVIAFAVDGSATRFVSSERWVTHTREVEAELARLNSDLSGAEAGRLSYVLTGDQSDLDRYSQSAQKAPDEIGLLRTLTADSSRELDNLDTLSPLVNQRLGLMKESIALRQNGPSADPRQVTLTSEERDLATKISALMSAMQQQEEGLLAQRQTISERGYRRLRAIVRTGLVLVVILLLANLWSLTAELRERKRAEDAVRRLNGHILRVQDEERRKIARELHDSLGQVLAALTMNLATLENETVILDRAKRSRLLSECLRLLEQGSAETRTLSYLLHPPLLDELGFAAAAKWYVEGFSQRSKIEVKLEAPSNIPRMTRDVELALFRVLQESLTNIHRHSGSSSADISLESKRGNVILTITDHGAGIPASLLEKFRKSATGTGVGLAGMRERVTDLGGEMDVRSEGRGTTVKVTLPVPREKDATQGTHVPPVGEASTEAVRHI